MRFGSIFTVFTLGALFLAGNAQAGTYYVSPSGNNSNNGSLATPWNTIAYGLARLSSGDTLMVRGGTYNETATISKSNVTLKSYPGETVVIDGKETLPTSFYGALITISAIDVTVDGLQLYRSKSRGIAISSGAHRARCSNLKISYCWMSGFSIPASSVKPADVILENSDIFRNERRYYYYLNPSLRPDSNWNYESPWGANVSIVGGLRTIVRNNRIYENYFEGLGFYKDTEGALAEGNVIYGNNRLQVYLSSSRLCTVRNNIIYGLASWEDTKPAMGIAAIWLAGETWAAAPDRDYGHRVYGNFVANSNKNVWIAGEGDAATRDSYIYNNVFVEALNRNGTAGTGFQVQSGKGGGTGNVFKNNAILQNTNTVAIIQDTARISASSNLWSRSPVPDAKGSGDIITNFTLTKDFATTTIQGGSLKLADFSFKTAGVASSLAINMGSWLTKVNMPTGAKNSTTLIVENAGYFYGDERLKLENGQTTTIKSISGNTLTVSPAITVTNGIGVSLYDFTSSQPNIGPWVFNKIASPSQFTLVVDE